MLRRGATWRAGQLRTWWVALPLNAFQTVPEPRETATAATVHPLDTVLRPGKTGRMFSSQPVRGSSLSEGQLCFTFDDGPGAMSRPEGPGPRTLDLARFMSEAEVPCTFFM